MSPCASPEPGALLAGRLALGREADGYHSVLDPDGAAGDRYTFELAAGTAFPCPASRYQPDGVSGPSMVIDPRSFRWSDAAWARPAFRDPSCP